MLRVESLCITVDSFSLQDVSFDVGRDEYFVLLGESGVGKSMILECISGLRESKSGSITLNDEDITHRKAQHRNVALAYQDPALFPHMSVKKNIAYGQRKRESSPESREKRLTQLAKQMGIESLLSRHPESLSGGEAQRVSLARALATEPTCLLLDEPLSALDAGARGELRSVLRTLHSTGLPIVHVTHDYEEAIALGTRVGILEDGRIVQTGTPQEIFQHPKSKFVAQFVGLRNIWSGELRGNESDSFQNREFHTADLVFAVSTEADAGKGSLVLRSEDVTVSNGRPEGSARNTHPGTVNRVSHARLGIEVVVDIGIEVTALVTDHAVKQLELVEGREVWISFKATAARFLTS